MNGWLKFYPSRRVNYATKVVIFLFLLSSFVFPLNSVKAQTVSSVSGTVFEDLNFNNTLDHGEKPLSAWQVNLYQNDQLVQTQLTDQGGSYYFAGLAAGNYLLKLALPDTWTPVVAKNVLFNLKADQAFNVNFANYQLIQEKQNFGPMLVISNINFKPLSPTSIEVSWFTTHQATSQVVFGQTTTPDAQLGSDINFGYPASSTVDFKVATYHSVTLVGLKPATTYYYRVSSLADPRQWRGARRIFSPEFSFTTASLPPLEPKSIISETEVAPEIKSVAELPKIGKILATQNESDDLAVTDNSGGKKENSVAPGSNNQPEDQKQTNSALPADCPGYIWFSLVLNLLAILVIRSKGKRVNNLAVKRLWWIMTILVAVPVIMGYPACWLTSWLLLTLFLELIFLFGFKKKKPPQNFEDIPSPFSDE